MSVEMLEVNNNEELHVIRILIAMIVFLLVSEIAIASDALPDREKFMGPYQSPATTDRFMGEYIPRLREERGSRFSELNNNDNNGMPYTDRNSYDPDYFPNSGFDKDYGFGYDYDYYDQDRFDYGYDGNNHYGYELNE